MVALSKGEGDKADQLIDTMVKFLHSLELPERCEVIGSLLLAVVDTHRPEEIATFRKFLLDDMQQSGWDNATVCQMMFFAIASEYEGATQELIEKYTKGTI